MDECVNCGMPYEKGSGFPASEFECCCDAGCFAEFCGFERDEDMVYVPYLPKETK